MSELKSKSKGKTGYRSLLILLGIALFVLAGNAILGKGGLQALLEARRENQGLDREIGPVGEAEP